MPWETSDRRATLPPDWPAIRRRVLARDKYTCQTCGLRATDVDHMSDRHDHRMGNLQALCFNCHRAKTNVESAAARAAMRAKARHPRERHPGLR